MFDTINARKYVLCSISIDSIKVMSILKLFNPVEFFIDKLH